MRLFGLTGGVASGKSLVSARFQARGVPVVDADELAREAVAPGSLALASIRAHFGPDVLDNLGRLRRAELAERVFNAPEQLAELNRIVHPEVARLLAERAADFEAQGEPWLCYALPLLFENQLQERFAPVVLVAASPETQIARAALRPGWTEAQTRARMQAQMPLAAKRALADYVIENDGALSDTLDQADRVLAAIRASA